MDRRFAILHSHPLARHALFRSGKSVWSNGERHEATGYECSLSLHAELTPVADSVARSPLYSIYGETIVGVPVLRAFGASSKFMRDMLRCVDTVSRCAPICSHPLTY